MKTASCTKPTSRGALLLALLCLVLTVFPLFGRADTGPKPTLTIVVKHPPQEEYYLDLLLPEKKGSFDNLQEHRDEYDAAKLDRLHSLEKEGWYPALAGYTAAPLFGDLIGERDGETMRHVFSYHGVPDRFRIAIVTPDNCLIVSDEVQTKAFYAVVSCDYAAADLAAAEQDPVRPDPSFVDYHPRWWLDYLRQFAATCLPTLLIEGILLLLFRFSLRRNAALFLGVNVGTQLLLTALSGTVFLFCGLEEALWSVLAAEAGIFLIETLVYARWLRGHTPRRRILYALAANAASALAGFLSLFISGVW